MTRSVLFTIGVIIGIATSCILGDGTVWKVQSHTYGVELVQCFADGTPHGKSVVVHGWITSEKQYDNGMVVEATYYDQQGNVITHIVENNQQALVEVK